jgi:hypothetical protein
VISRNPSKLPALPIKTAAASKLVDETVNSVVNSVQVPAIASQIAGCAAIPKQQAITKAQCENISDKTSASIAGKCGSCKKPASNSCGRCLKVKYCSRECQLAHRRVHKKECVAAAESV